MVMALAFLPRQFFLNFLMLYRLSLHSLHKSPKIFLVKASIAIHFDNMVHPVFQRNRFGFFKG